MAAWIKPKSAHKHMMQTLLQVKAHLIPCFRAEEKIEMVRIDGKLEVRKKESLIGKDGWVPICEKNVPFEATCSFLLLASNPGLPNPIKLQKQHKPFFTTTACIDECAGEQLAKWAAGGAATDTRPVEGAGTGTSPPDGSPQASDAPAPTTGSVAEEMAALVAKDRAYVKAADTEAGAKRRYESIPEERRQESWPAYTDTLRKFGTRKKP